MPTQQEIDDYRDRLTAGFEREYQETEAQLASLNGKRLELETKLERLKTQPPFGACYRCYFDTGFIAKIKPVPADPAAPGIDCFVCENGHPL